MKSCMWAPNSGQMYALNTTTGHSLEFRERRLCNRWAINRRRRVYWGPVIENIAGTGNNKVYAFTPAGSKDPGDHSSTDIQLNLRKGAAK